MHDINENDFDHFYNSIFLKERVHIEIIGMMTKFFYEANIDPLEYIIQIPSYYLFETHYNEEIIIPDHITKINDCAFTGCDFSKIIIPESVEYIGAGVFQNCHWLNIFILNKGIKAIGPDAFARCKRLNRIYYRGTIKEFKSTGLHKKLMWRSESKIDLICCQDGNLNLEW